MSRCTCDPLDLGSAGHLLGCPLNPQTVAPVAIVQYGSAEWPYSTHDEVSHLAVTDARVLRGRIDMLIEERKEWRQERLLGVPAATERSEWKLTPMEGRFVTELLRRKTFVTRERLHTAMSGEVEPTTAIKMVDVIACKVRKKLRAHLPEGADALDTKWGKGYAASKALRKAVS